MGRAAELHAPAVVTAADHRYYRTLCQMLLSAERHGLHREHPFVVFDLGLTDADARHLGRRFGWCGVRPFPFDRYPPHVRDLVFCAWKPIAIEAVLQERRGLLLWLDSATIFHGSLGPLFERTARYGVFSLLCQSPLRRWSDPRTPALLGVPAGDLDKRTRFGGALGLDGARAEAGDLVACWRACALREECIHPPGADRRAYRYDQTVLTALLYRFERERGLVLTDEEVDISSCAPIPWISTRNKVVPRLPLAADPLARAYHAAYKRLDRAVLRARRALTSNA